MSINFPVTQPNQNSQVFEPQDSILIGQPFVFACQPILSFATLNAPISHPFGVAYEPTSLKTPLEWLQAFSRNPDFESVIWSASYNFENLTLHQDEVELRNGD